MQKEKFARQTKRGSEEGMTWHPGANEPQQQQNVKRDIVPKLDASELKSGGSVNVETVDEDKESGSIGDKKDADKSE